ncbi:MAG: TonB-dependent receptor [Bacteroidales bacterium]|nr:TonB-dependent receptor [Bacteroidales bacterium]
MKTYYVKNLLLVAVMLIAFHSLGQHVNGLVVELVNHDTIPLPGVNVYWAGTHTGAVSDIDGKFEVTTVKDSHYLIFSFVGYTNDTIHYHADGRPLLHIMQQPLSLDEVEVVNRAKTNFVSRLSSVNATTITSGELQRAACCNLSESFETSASVDVSYSDAVTGARQIEMLGLAGIYTQMMGENIPNLRGLANGFGLLFIPGSWMESIQVSKGTSSVINGYESITGQINVEFKKPAESERFFFNLFQSQAGRSEGNFNFRLNPGKNLKTMLFGHISNNSIKHDGNKDGFLDDPLYTQYNLFNRWDFHYQRLEMQFGIKALNETRKGGQSGYTHSLLQSEQSLYGTQVTNTRYEAFLKTGYIFHKPATSLGFQQQLTHHELSSFYGIRSYDATQQSYYGNLLFQSFIKDTRHSYTTGLSMVYDRFSSNGEEVVNNLIEAVPGAFFQYTFSDGTRLNFIAGLRTDYHNLHGLFITPRLHARYNISEHSIVRVSAGKGFRSARVIAENLSALASGKPFHWMINGINAPLKMEEAWNFGVNISQYFTINNKELALNLDVYRTSFINQVVVDRHSSMYEILVYNLQGPSYSNSLQLEANYELVNGLDVTAAFRYNDVKVTYMDQLQERPLVNKYKGLLSFSYKPSVRWQYDLTGLLTGPASLPLWALVPDPDSGTPYSPAYVTLNAQITRNFRKLNLYIGGENLTNYTQKNPIIDHENPFSNTFDASMIWGPLMGAKVYAGLRYTIE